MISASHEIFTGVSVTMCAGNFCSLRSGGTVSFSLFLLPKLDAPCARSAVGNGRGAGRETIDAEAGGSFKRKKFPARKKSRPEIGRLAPVGTAARSGRHLRSSPPEPYPRAVHCDSLTAKISAPEILSIVLVEIPPTASLIFLKNPHFAGFFAQWGCPTGHKWGSLQVK